MFKNLKLLVTMGRVGGGAGDDPSNARNISMRRLPSPRVSLY